MTFSPESVKLINREYSAFTQWAIPRNALFIPKWAFEENEDKRYDETSRMYLLMSRLHQPYHDIMTMDLKTRDALFDMEMDALKKRKEELDKSNIR